MTALLIVLAAIVVYGLFALVKPKKPCGKCGGWGNRKKRMRRRSSACGRCGGTGRQFRPGARLVGRGAVLAVRYVRERAEQRREAE